MTTTGTGTGTHQGVQSEATGGTSILGTRVRRIEDADLLVGRSTFIDGQQDSSVLHAAFVRSPFAHAEVGEIDTEEATRSPGVVAVLTADDFDGLVVPPFLSANKAAVRHPLATDRVRYVGDPVAMVIADTRAHAADAVELVEADLEPLPVVSDMEQALAPDAPLLFDDIAGNVAVSMRTEEMDAPWPSDAQVVRLRMENQRVAAAPMEGHAILARPGVDGADQSHQLTVHIGSQSPHMTKAMIAAMTGLEPDAVRVIAPHVGGGFGGKIGASAEHLAVVAAARVLDRPVKWVETRSEAMISMQGRGQVQYAELGLDSEGHILGLRARVVGDAGGYAGFGGTFATVQTHLMAQGVYQMPKVNYAGLGVVTNTSPTVAFRGAGRPEAAAMIERLIDLAADEVGLAPEEIRRRNLIPPEAFPFETHTGARYDVGDYDRPLTEALRVADVEALRAEQRRRRENGAVKQLGIGLSTYVEITGFGGTEFGSVEVHPDGSATVTCGTAAQGQGHATAFAMIVSEQLGIPVDRIELADTDTAVVPTGGGTGGSRSLQIGGSAVRGAAVKVYDRAREIAGRLLEAATDDVELIDGGFGVRGVPGASLSWAEVATEAQSEEGGLRDTEDFLLEAATFPFGAHVSVVEVDLETGFVTPVRHIAVDDCGTVLNPLLVQGQQHGGALQGISQALWEHFEYDAEGTPLTSTFVDYAIPTAADTVSYETSNTETPTPINPLGAKGIGESATIGSTPAVQNAVIDAVSHLGVRHIDLPCTPQRVWRAIQQARSGTLPDPWSEPPTVFDDIPAPSERKPKDPDDGPAIEGA